MKQDVPKIPLYLHGRKKNFSMVPPDLQWDTRIKNRGPLTKFSWVPDVCWRRRRELAAASRTFCRFQNFLPPPELAATSRACYRRYSTCSETDATLASYCHPPFLPPSLRYFTCSENDATLASCCHPTSLLPSLPPSLPPSAPLPFVGPPRRWPLTA